MFRGVKATLATSWPWDDAHPLLEVHPASIDGWVVNAVYSDAWGNEVLYPSLGLIVDRLTGKERGVSSEEWKSIAMAVIYQNG